MHFTKIGSDENVVAQITISWSSLRQEPIIFEIGMPVNADSKAKTN